MDDLFSSSAITSTEKPINPSHLPAKDVLPTLDRMKERLAGPRSVDHHRKQTESTIPNVTDEAKEGVHGSAMQPPAQPSPTTVMQERVTSKEDYSAIIQRLEAEIVSAELSLPTSSTATRPKLTTPLELASQKEWDALFQATVRFSHLPPISPLADLL